MSASPPPAAPKVVLIAEDEEPLARALAYIVEDAGYTPIVAYHGKAALKLALEHRPALIIADLMMPQMSGTELISTLHAAWNSAAPPIVLMTAAGRRYVEQSGADAVLPKPFEITEVEALLQRFLADA
jgi:DNA-binding response OmpR family regulator